MPSIIQQTLRTLSPTTQPAQVQCWIDTYSTGSAASGYADCNTLRGLSGATTVMYSSTLRVPKDGNWYFFAFNESPTGKSHGAMLFNTLGTRYSGEVNSAHFGEAWRWYNNQWWRCYVSSAGAIYTRIAMAVSYVECTPGLRTDASGAFVQVLMYDHELPWIPNIASRGTGAEYQAPTYALLTL